MYAKITNGLVNQYPYTIGQLRRDNPNISFPRDIPIATLQEHGVEAVTYLEQPSYTERTHTCSQNAAPTLVDGAWTTGWTVSAKSADETAAYDAEAATAVRAERDRLLAASDWVTIRAKELGQTVPDAWFTYRGDLRQIPEQAGFPHSVTYPTIPS